MGTPAQPHGIVSKLVDSLAHHVVHLVGRARSVGVVVSLEQMARQVTWGEGTAGLMQGGTSALNRLRNQTLLYS